MRSLSDNQLCGVYEDKYGRIKGTYNDVGIKAIADALKVNAVLTSLDVSYNSLTEEAALGILRVERERNKLKSLGLAGCSIGPSGAAEIAEALKVNTDLDFHRYISIC